MTRLFVAAATLAFGTIVSTGSGYAQLAVDIGKREYVLSCAACHGVNGKGDGPVAEYLRKAPTDLTMIQKNNNGVFPFEHLFVVIDGRQAVAAHGPREMTVFGREFSDDAAELTRGFWLNPIYREAFVRGRIVALIGYIYSLQAK